MVATNNRYACQHQNRFGVVAAKNEDVRGSENENQTIATPSSPLLPSGLDAAELICAPGQRGKMSVDIPLYRTRFLVNYRTKSLLNGSEILVRNL